MASPLVEAAPVLGGRRGCPVAVALLLVRKRGHPEAPSAGAPAIVRGQSGGPCPPGMKKGGPGREGDHVVTAVGVVPDPRGQVPGAAYLGDRPPRRVGRPRLAA